ALNAGFRHLSGVPGGVDPRPPGHRLCAGVWTHHPGAGRRAACNRARRHVLVFLRPAQDADRFHLSVDVDDRDLSGTDLLQLRARAIAAPPDPLRLQPVSFARAGRAARAVAGKARARRRGARDDHHVLRRARLHHDLGDLQARPARADRADEPLPDAADR
ncbi:hypothetical protein KXV85_005535, partial [Aspergillus fumigatus]